MNDDIKNKIRLTLTTPQAYRYLQKNDPDLYYDIHGLTQFLPQNVKLKERVYCILNDIKEQPNCPVCGGKLEWDGKNRVGYKQYCSTKCMSNSEKVKEKRQKTSIEKYGTRHHLMSEEVIQKRMETNTKKYGTPHISQVPEVRDKVSNKLRARTQDEWDNITQKREDTVSEKYGVHHVSQSDGVKRKKKKTVETLYGVKNTFLLKKARERYNDYYSEKYGSVSEKLTDKQWIETQHFTHNKPIKNIADELGVSSTTVYNYMRQFGIEPKNNGYSVGEKEVLEHVKSIYHGVVIENDRSIIAPKELDIVIPEKKIAIEYCGLYWHSSDKKEPSYHLEKLEQCNSNGYRLITIFEDEWQHNKELVKEKISSILGVNTQRRIYGRNTEVTQVYKSDRAEFLNKYHIQGDTNGSISYGLLYDGELVSVMVFKKRTDDTFELVRFASSCNVVGAFSKLLTHFQRNNDWESIVSFADRRWSEGGVYKKNGFFLTNISRPEYRYIIGDQRVHKFSFRHKNLNKILISYDPKKSEFQNTEANGIYRIYDCGLLKYEMKRTP